MTAQMATRLTVRTFKHKNAKSLLMSNIRRSKIRQARSTGGGAPYYENGEICSQKLALLKTPGNKMYISKQSELSNIFTLLVFKIPWIYLWQAYAASLGLWNLYTKSSCTIVEYSWANYVNVIEFIFFLLCHHAFKHILFWMGFHVTWPKYLPHLQPIRKITEV